MQTIFGKSIDRYIRQGDAMNQRMTTRDELRGMIQYAPRDSGPIANGLRGWEMPGAVYICAPCAGRIMRRGCQLPSGAFPVWSDHIGPAATCCCCDAEES